MDDMRIIIVQTMRRWNISSLYYGLASKCIQRHIDQSDTTPHSFN